MPHSVGKVNSVSSGVICRRSLHSLQHDRYFLKTDGWDPWQAVSFTFEEEEWWKQEGCQWAYGEQQWRGPRNIHLDSDPPQPGREDSCLVETACGRGCRSLLGVRLASSNTALTPRCRGHTQLQHIKACRSGKRCQATPGPGHEHPCSQLPQRQQERKSRADAGWELPGLDWLVSIRALENTPMTRGRLRKGG